MKKLLTVAIFIYSLQVFAQNNPYEVGDNTVFVNGRPKLHLTYLDDYKWAAGIQYSLPVLAFSLKYAITDHSVVQAFIFPGTVNNGIENYSFYGARYMYRFGFNYVTYKEPFTLTYPYVFGCAGLLNSNTHFMDDAGASHSDASVFAYCAGVGYEIVYHSHFGVAAEIGYGAYSIYHTSAQTDLTGGLAMHYYFGGIKAAPTEKEATAEDGETIIVDDQDGNIMENDAQGKKGKDKNKGKKSKHSKPKKATEDESEEE
jgi:hypothetical protein